MIGKILNNRYQIESKIGSGGMAEVYKAKCNLLNRYVAVKILRNNFNNNEEFVKRFQIEASAAARLSHPNIVSIHDVGIDKEAYYIVMEYIDGITLKEYIQAGKINNYEEAVHICVKICSAIEKAHNNKIIHRDIKPQNIMITEDGNIKVADFGIVKMVDSETLTIAGTTMGSVHYFSPEQASAKEVDERSDIYSIGIVLYEMITGKLPFNGDTPIAIAIKQIQEEPVNPKEIERQIPLTLSSITLKTIKKDPKERYQNITELIDDLKSDLNNINGEWNYKKYGGINNFENNSIPNKNNGNETIFFNQDMLKETQDANSININHSNLMEQNIRNNQNDYKQKDDLRISNYNINEVLGKKTNKSANTNNINNYNNNNNNNNNNTNNAGKSVLLNNLKSSHKIGGLIVLILLLVTFYQIGSALGGNIIQSEKGKFEVGDYKNQDFKTVEKMLVDENGWKPILIDGQAVNSSLKKGLIIKNTRAGETVQKNKVTIRFEYSNGKKVVKIPPIEGESFKDAALELLKTGLKINTKVAKKSAEKEFVVESVSPSVGTIVEKGSTVDLYISKGNLKISKFNNLQKQVSNELKKLEKVDQNELNYQLEDGLDNLNNLINNFSN